MKKEEKVDETKVAKAKVEKAKEVKETKSIPGIYIASLAVGISGIVISGFPILGLLVSIAGIVVSVIAMKKLKAQGEKHGFVTAGLVTSIVGTVISAIVTIIMIAMIVIGVYNANSASKVLSKANAAAKDTAIEVFNERFTLYEGENQTGVMVNMLLEEVIQNNNSSSNNKIRVDADYDTGIQFVGNPPTKILSKARASEKYDVEVEKDYTGRVSKIIIEK